MNEEEQKLAIEGLSKFYLAHLITWVKNNPEEFAESYGKQITENTKLRIELNKYKDDYKRMKENFDAKVDVIEDLHKDLEEYNDKLNQVVKERNELLKKSYSDDVKITKAIEFIKEEQELTDIDDVINTDKLLNILKGDIDE